MNLCQLIVQSAERYPDRVALNVPLSNGEYSTLTYRDFINLAGHFQRQLIQSGFTRGDRLVLLLPPGLYLYPLLMAMLGIGIVAVMPERGLTRAQFRATLRHCRPKAIITVATTGKWWPLIPELWWLKRFVVGHPVLGMQQLQVSVNVPDGGFICQSLTPDATGLITFTSGTTGIPKGANRTHGSLMEQQRALESLMLTTDHDIDLFSFPVLVLQTLSMGQQSILPYFDFARPACVNPADVIQQIGHFGVTRISGAPAYMQKIIGYAQARRLTFSKVRQIIIGGAPGSKALYQSCLQVFPLAQQMVIYGSTEAEPIACVDIQTLTERWSQHDGYLVGKPIKVAEICLRDIMPNGESGTLKPPIPGDIGEILVAGPHVLSEYIDNPQATRRYKIPRKQGGIWHCTGDVGYFDEGGQIWLLGRVNDSIAIDQYRIIHPYIIEKRLNDLKEIERCALVAHPQGNAALILQCTSLPQELSAILVELQLIDVTQVYQLSEMPVDVRHNSKINRLKLKRLLAKNALKVCRLNRASL
ncbi:AMP-binding protein [Serratia fonticola]|uniref:AMP-binding protein n=1 Tax=Serratia fonticola TaxID=47917 RepID=UPI001FD7FCC0|nr:AMP-binding protein [Serratia fonticola]